MTYLTTSDARLLGKIARKKIQAAIEFENRESRALWDQQIIATGESGCAVFLLCVMRLRLLRRSEFHGVAQLRRERIGGSPGGARPGQQTETFYGPPSIGGPHRHNVRNGCGTLFKITTRRCAEPHSTTSMVWPASIPPAPLVQTPRPKLLGRQQAEATAALSVNL